MLLLYVSNMFQTCLLVGKVTMEFDDTIWRLKFGYIFDIPDILSEEQNKWIFKDRLKYDFAPYISASGSCYYLYDGKYSPSKNHVIKTPYLELQTYCLLQIIGDVTKEDTLDPKLFKGIKKVVSAVSVIVGPKEGDTPDREKYKQVRHMLSTMICEEFMHSTIWLHQCDTSVSNSCRASNFSNLR